MGYNDIKILEGIAGGDETILKYFYKKNFRGVRKYILANNGTEEDTEDVFQDSLIIIYQKLTKGMIELNCSVHTYFYSICKNVWRNRLRKNDKLEIHDDIVSISNSIVSDINDDIERGDREHIYRKHFMKLDGKCRSLLSLLFEGKSAREVATALNYSEIYVRKKKFGCKECLLRMIRQDPIYKELILNPTDIWVKGA